jgi:hypothetical protein
VIARIRISDDPAVAMLQKLFERRCNQVYVSRTSAVAVIENDSHENKFLECALAAGAKYIVSGDRHLLNLKTFKGIRILPPTDFLKIKL